MKRLVSISGKQIGTAESFDIAYNTHPLDNLTQAQLKPKDQSQEVCRVCLSTVIWKREHGVLVCPNCRSSRT